MINISASLVKDYLACSKKVSFRRSGEGIAVQTPDMLVGNIVHKLIEDGVDDYEKYIEATNLDRSKKQKAKICMSNYHLNYRMLTSPTDDVEKFFKYPFSRGVNIVGKFDRVLLDGVIIDWKSGNPPTSIDTDIQFLMYYEAYKHIHGKEPNSVFGIFLLKNKMLKYNHNSFFKKVVYDDIIPNIVQSIKSGKFYREGIFKNICHNCAYKDYCY